MTYPALGHVYIRLGSAWSSIELLTLGALAGTFGCHVAAVAVYNHANSTVGSLCCKAN